MSDDLVKRLRQSWEVDRSIISQTGQWMTERKEAADLIEYLEAENAILRTEKHADAEALGALEEVVKAADVLRESVIMDHDPHQSIRALDRYEAARAKLEERG